MESSVPLNIFLEHINAAQEQGTIPSRLSNAAGARRGVLTNAEEQQLLRLFVPACHSASVSFDDVVLFIENVLNISAPPNAKLLNASVGIPSATARYTWKDVLGIAQAAKAQAKDVVTDISYPSSTRYAESGDGWSQITEELFGLLTEGDEAPTVSTSKACALLVALVSKHRKRAVRHCDAVKSLIPDIMTHEEFEKHIVLPLRALLLREPHPTAPPVASTTSLDVASLGLFALSDMMEKRKDSSNLLSSIASLDERQRRARKLRSWVIAHPKSYFNVPPCLMRSTDLWHLQKLKHNRLRNFVVRMRKDFLRFSSKPKKWHQRVVRCVERAEELMLRHADRCERCVWLTDRFGNHLEGSRSFSSFRKSPSFPAADKMVPTIEVEVRKPFTPRINKPSAFRSPRKPTVPLQVNESLFVARIFERSKESPRASLHAKPPSV